MIDIHTHVIPFVDDGSKSLEDSIAMIEEEVSFGVDIIICTPHHIRHKYVKNIDEIRENFHLLQDEVKKRAIPVTLYLGQEIYYNEQEDIIGMLKQNELLTLNQTNKVLLEFSFFKEPNDLEEILYNFKINGFEVILAHVERYEWMTLAHVKALRGFGAKIQINANSYIGDCGYRMKAFCKKLIQFDLVDYIASDMHAFRRSKMNLAYKKCKNKNLFKKAL